MMIVILVAVAVVGAQTAMVIFCDAERVGRRKIEEMTADYYENYLYDQVVKGKASLAEAFKDYKESGFPIVRLRSLLLYDNEKNGQERRFFEQKDYNCNTNESFVTIWPVEPYGRKDWRAEYKMSCQKV